MSGRLTLRKDAPAPTTLEQVPFRVLGVTTRDSRQRIVERAEEKSLVGDVEACTKARADLINPRTRLTAEIGWLPGLSPTRADTYCALLREDIDRLLETARGEAALVRANLISAALELLDASVERDDWVTSILTLAYECEQVDAGNVLQTINEDRAVAGFPKVSALDLVKAELDDRCHRHMEAVRASLDRLSTTKMLAVISGVVADATGGGTRPAPRLVDALIDSITLDCRRFLDQEADAVRTIVERATKAAPGGEAAVGPWLDHLERVCQNWNRVSRPIQVSLKTRGSEHEESRAVAYAIRNLAIALFNEHDLLVSARRLTALLRDAFADLPELAERIDQDAGALDDIARRRGKAREDAEEWAREITYEADIGVLFKDTLRISPDGIEWRGTLYHLASISRVGWGATRHSVNGIPTGTEYHVFFGDANQVACVTTRREEVYSDFVDRLWKAVCVRLLTELLRDLAAGNRVRFGDATLDDCGLHLLQYRRYRLSRADKQIFADWSQLRVWSAEGWFYVGVRDDMKTRLALKYQEANNAHILEAAIRAAFKNGLNRLSAQLEGPRLS